MRMGAALGPMWTERWRTGGRANPWPTFVIGSGVAHLALLVACLLLRPVAEHSHATLRIRLVEEGRVPAAAPVATDIPHAPTPTKVPTALRPRMGRVPPLIMPPKSEPAVPAVPHLEPLLPSPPAPADAHDPAAAPNSSLSTPVVPSPAPGTAAPPMLERPALPSGSLAASAATGASGSPISRDEASLPVPGGGSGASGPTRVSDDGPRGVFLLSGQGQGSGAGSGSGGGPGNGVGWGSGTGAGGAAGGGDSPGGGYAALTRGGNGSGSGGRNGEQLLRTIRRQIERVWSYPDAARRDGLEGTVWLRFRIAPDGSVAQVEVDRSSGHALLDDAAITAVRRAGPYPPYGGPIRYPFTYRLDR